MGVQGTALRQETLLKQQRGHCWKMVCEMGLGHCSKKAGVIHLNNKYWKYLHSFFLNKPNFYTFSKNIFQEGFTCTYFVQHAGVRVKGNPKSSLLCTTFISFILEFPALNLLELIPSNVQDQCFVYTIHLTKHFTELSIKLSVSITYNSVTNFGA